MWDPKKYLAFDDHRSRPFFELLGRIGAEDPRRVVDLGCGPGHLTASLAERWPGAVIDAWETTYLQRLSGEDPVLEWVTGTALRPVRNALDDTAWQEFTAQLAPLLRAAYPRQLDGTTWLPFRRVFSVAHKTG